MVSNIRMKKEEYITVEDLQIRVRPVPSWNADGSPCNVFLCQPIGGGNGIRLGGDSAEDVAFGLERDSDTYCAIKESLVRSNHPIPQSYLDMCKGQEL